VERDAERVGHLEPAISDHLSSQNQMINISSFNCWFFKLT
jgi:hypothetical protein